MSLNLIFTNNVATSFKTHAMQCARASVSAIIRKLGYESKNYDQMSDISFSKSTDVQKMASTKNKNESCRCCKKKEQKVFILSNRMNRA